MGEDKVSYAKVPPPPENLLGFGKAHLIGRFGWTEYDSNAFLNFCWFRREYDKKGKKVALVTLDRVHGVGDRNTLREHLLALSAKDGTRMFVEEGQYLRPTSIADQAFASAERAGASQDEAGVADDIPMGRPAGAEIPHMSQANNVPPDSVRIQSAYQLLLTAEAIEHLTDIEHLLTSRAPNSALAELTALFERHKVGAERFIDAEFAEIWRGEGQKIADAIGTLAAALDFTMDGEYYDAFKAEAVALAKKAGFEPHAPSPGLGVLRIFGGRFQDIFYPTRMRMLDQIYDLALSAARPKDIPSEPLRRFWKENGQTLRTLFNRDEHLNHLVETGIMKTIDEDIVPEIRAMIEGHRFVLRNEMMADNFSEDEVVGSIDSLHSLRAAHREKR